MWAKSLELNGAVRATNYSTIGYVTTWKFGATYDVGPFLFRGNRSRDIRAPSLGELYTPGNTGFTTVTDPNKGGVSVLPQYLQTGNANLTAEKADSWGAGAVFHPDFIPGLSFSADYYDVTINDAISTVSFQQIVNRCYSGNTSFCSLITRDTAGNITLIQSSPVNFVKQTQRGLDLELGYQLPLRKLFAASNATFALHGYASHIFTFEQNDGVTKVVNAAGSISAPSWRWMVNASYATPTFTFTLTGRGLTPTNYNTTSTAYVECTATCPVSTTANPTINTNRIAGAAYLDLSLSWHVKTRTMGSFDPFVAIQNVFDRDPSVNPASLFEGRASVSNQFDLLGRLYRVGIRFKY